MEYEGKKKIIETEKKPNQNQKNKIKTKPKLIENFFN